MFLSGILKLLPLLLQLAILTEAEKPGFCPLVQFNLTTVTACPSHCTQDSDCQENQKCCRNTCRGLQCVDPIHSGLHQKPGLCPTVEFNLTGVSTCPSDCTDDFSCDGDQKCCRNTCAKLQCGDPIQSKPEKPGMCPPVYVNVTGARRCYTDCTHDYECNGERKCCRNPCGKSQCVNPVDPEAETSNRCPATLPDRAGTQKCYHDCRDDNDCDGHKICCEMGCSSRCTDPTILDARIRCLLPVDAGSCKEKVSRWYYDEEKGKCRKFTYKGCEGNLNRFESQDECDKVCNPCYGKKPEQCDPDDNPLCVAFWTQKWYYNKRIKKCKKLNAFNICSELCSRNVYDSQEKCLDKCVITCPEPEDIENGKVNAKHWTVGSFAKYSCNEGFTLVGKYKRRCKLNKNLTSASWRPRAPTCEQARKKKNI